jgi:hypothetical protein
MLKASGRGYKIDQNMHQFDKLYVKINIILIYNTFVGIT